MAIEPAARGVKGGAHRDKNIVMRLEFRGAAANRDHPAGKGQLNAEVSHPSRPLRAMPALDDHPTRSKPIEDAFEALGALANLLLDSR